MTPEIITTVVFTIFFSVICLAILALLIVSMWKIYGKMGEPGWKCIVPFYSNWVLIERLRKPRSWFWIMTLCGLIICVLYVMLLVRIIGCPEEMPAGTILLILVILAVAVVSLVYGIKITHALSKAFGQGTGFTVGMILLPVVFYPVLAFGSYQFQPEEEKILSV
jgi:hypothetical protein